MALKCLNAAANLDATHPGVHERTVEFKHALDAASATIPAKVGQVIEAEFKAPTGDLSQFNQRFSEENKASPAHALAAIKSRRVLGQSLAETEQELLALLDSKGMTFELAGSILDLLKTWRSKEASAFRAKAQGKWPGVTLFA